MNRRSQSLIWLPLAIAICFALATTNAGTLNIPPLPSPESLATITAHDLKRHVAFLASDELGGRYTFSPSNRIAARYLAAQLETYGYRGAARDGSFLQRVPVGSSLTHNVVGILEGSDPKLKDEYIVLSAHYDHLETKKNGQVFNGADDNASGTAGVLEVAQAFAAAPRPKRSVLVVFYTAEELGLVGSKFNTEREPVVPLAQAIANFNMDMIGRSQDDAKPFLDPDTYDRTSSRNSVYIVGDDKLSSLLRTISERTNAETSRLSFDYTYNDPNHPSRLYKRIDSYSYAKRGVPAISYFTGWHSDYHKTTDDMDKLDFEKMERISRLAFATSWRVANLDQRLPIDRK